MFRTIADFKQQWQSESGFTLSILQALTDSSLNQSISNEHRTIGRIAWHIAGTIPEMMSLTGLAMNQIDKIVPGKASKIAETYEQQANMLLTQVMQKWHDADLLIEEELYGERWARGKTLLILIKHEIHHRGQLTVLMRQAGVVVPSMYGPAKEGWTAYGQEPPQI